MKVKLGELTSIKTGKLDANAASEDGEYPFFTCSKDTLKISTYTYDCECVLVAGNGDLNVKYYNGKFDAYQRTYIIENNSNNKLFMLYLYFFLENYIEELREQAIGGVIKYIKLGNLANAEIELPPLKEQIKIVTILKKVKEIISEKNRQILELDILIKARFVEMFGDPVMNLMDWPVCELSEQIEFLTSGSRGWAKYFTGEGEYFITIKNVKNCRLILDEVQHIIPPDNAEAKRTRVQEGDLLISITADLGRTAVVTKDVADYGGYINQHLTCIRLNKTVVCPLYVAYYMESEAGKKQFQSKNQSAVKAGLNFNSINTLKLMLPPLQLQNQFAAFVAQTDKSKVAIQKSLDETQLLFDSLMQEYFG